ncbi:hypothetical protein [Frankia sp. Cr1]|uniref:hypothetical protein n=1 Tax=Frankia sp. Cr1 TaxID=3073931 RepID=UPI002AD4344E|nr:hypothetical protein [Frankia sp. Cr1]
MIGKTGRRPGRPDKLDPTAAKTIVDALRAGSHQTYAVDLAGVGSTTYYRWLRHGREDRVAGRETKFAEFVADVARARAHVQLVLVTQIRTAAAGGDWRAAAWVLSHAFPEWSDKIDLNVGMDQEEFERAVEAIAELLAGGPSDDLPSGEAVE